VRCGVIGSAVPPDLTVSIAARSTARSSVTVVRTGRSAVEMIRISSIIAPSGTMWRSRSIRTVGSAIGSPSQRATETNTVRDPVDVWPTASGSRPSSRSTASERIRRSAWNMPCTPDLRICPSGPDSTDRGAHTVATRS
jgi:hypothetical protein